MLPALPFGARGCMGHVLSWQHVTISPVCWGNGATVKHALAIALAMSLSLGISACASVANPQEDVAKDQATNSQGNMDESVAPSEPSSSEAGQADDGKLDSRDIMRAAFEESPIPSRLARNILVGLERDGVRPVTFDTDIGEFCYYVDVYTGEVVDRVEPDYTEEDLASCMIITSAQAKDAVFAVCPISAKQTYGMTISLKHPTWVVTFNSDYGHFSYVVDAKTGEILEKDEPEVPEDAPDPIDAARDACLATLDGYDGRATNMTLKLKGQQHKVVDVEFDWKGEHYSMEYDVSSKTVTNK